MESSHLYFDNSFAPGRVLTEVYVALPTCFFSKHERQNQVFKLKNGIYGHMDAALVLYDMLVSHFTNVGFYDLEHARCNSKRMT